MPMTGLRGWRTPGLVIGIAAATVLAGVVLLWQRPPATPGPEPELVVGVAYERRDALLVLPRYSPLDGGEIAAFTPSAALEFFDRYYEHGVPRLDGMGLGGTVGRPHLETEVTAIADIDQDGTFELEVGADEYLVCLVQQTAYVLGCDIVELAPGAELRVPIVENLPFFHVERS
jgi:hypothetical protein